MRITADDIKQIQLFKYYRIVRKWMCKANNLNDADLELLTKEQIGDCGLPH